MSWQFLWVQHRFLMSRFWVKFRDWLFNLPLFGDSFSNLFIYMPFTSVKSPFKPDLMVRPGVFTIFHGISWWHTIAFFQGAIMCHPPRFMPEVAVLSLFFCPKIYSILNSEPQPGCWVRGWSSQALGPGRLGIVSLWIREFLCSKKMNS